MKLTINFILRIAQSEEIEEIKKSEESNPKSQIHRSRKKKKTLQYLFLCKIVWSHVFL